MGTEAAMRDTSLITEAETLIATGLHIISRASPEGRLWHTRALAWRVELAKADAAARREALEATYCQECGFTHSPTERHDR